MKRLYFILIWCLFLQQLTAQSSAGKLQGLVRNMQHESLEGAAVTLMRVDDSTSIIKQITNSKGVFEFSNLLNGTYNLTITAAEMKEYVNSRITVDERHLHIELPVIILQPSQSSQLKAVVITSKLPLIVQDIDKTIVNVDAMISSATSNALEVLSKTPGVTVNNKDEIGLNGKDGVLVMIDGRATYLSAGDLAAYLKSIPGNLLDKIELMDNPSSKYDAAGSAIINIRLKKNKAGGLTGNLAAAYSQGVYARHNESISLNYNQKKINLFGTFSYDNEKSYVKNSYDRKFYDSDKILLSSVMLNNFQKNRSASYFTRVGMDYAVSPKTTYGFNVNMNYNPRRANLKYMSTSESRVNMPDSIGRGNVNGSSNRTNWSANINFAHKFNKDGREISADVNYIDYSTPGNQNITNIIINPDDMIIHKTHFFYDLLPSIHIYTAKVDYVHPLKNKILLEAGIKSSFVGNDDNAQYFNVNDNKHTPDYSKSNHFMYKEQIHAAYVNARKQWKRVGVQLGLRAEGTQLTGTLIANAAIEESTFKRHYTNFFPSAFVSYKLDSSGNNTLSFNFARRIRRPDYQQLNPFFAFRDNYSYSTGNPYIKPQFHYRSEMRYQYKQLLGLSLQYGRFTDVIFEITQAVDKIFITKPDNIATGNMLILSTNFNKSILTWWSVNTNIMLAHLSLKGMASTEKLRSSTSTIRINVLNQFNFKNGWSGEMTVYYAGKDIGGQTITQPRYRIYGAVQKKILKDKGAIRLSVEDIFHSWVQRDNSVGLKQATSYHTNESDTQRVGIAFSWRFGKDSFARKRKHADNAADAETERAN